MTMTRAEAASRRKEIGHVSNRVLQFARGIGNLIQLYDVPRSDKTGMYPMEQYDSHALAHKQRRRVYDRTGLPQEAQHFRFFSYHLCCVHR